jgi:hypothetical protein
VVCSSGISFDPVVDGERLTFGFEGIWQGTAVLYDHQTNSLWMHLTGECFAGRHRGAVLPRLPSGRHTTWSDWREAHPGSDVIRPDPRYAGQGGDRGYFTRSGAKSGSDYLPRTFGPTIQAKDDRLRPSDLVYGVVVKGTARAYPFDRLPEVIEESVADTPATVWLDRQSRSAAAFDRRLEGNSHSFVAAAPGLREDRETKSRWNMEGECVAGPLKGKRLAPLHGLMAEWYGWFAHYPSTSLWAE